MSGPPAASGNRLGVVLGSSLDHDPFSGRDDVVVLRRHGPSASVPAHLVDHRANVRTLVESGCDRVVAVGSAGSLRVDLGVGSVVAPDDYLALGAHDTFHTTTEGYGTRTFDLAWRARVIEAWRGVPGSRSIVNGGTYAQTRGPRFETPAEVRLLATAADLVGMTLASECMLAAEAGLAYAAVCQVDNLANGLEPGDVDPAAAYLAGTAAAGERLAAEVVACVDALLP
jgi:5'-methylthioadenosine phosphorylase